jgi:hypothetical protein
VEWTAVPFDWNPRALLLNMACAWVFPPWTAGSCGPYRARPCRCAVRVRAWASQVGLGHSRGPRDRNQFSFSYSILV